MGRGEVAKTTETSWVYFEVVICNIKYKLLSQKSVVFITRMASFMCITELFQKLGTYAAKFSQHLVLLLP